MKTLDDVIMELTQLKTEVADQTATYEEIEKTLCAAIEALEEINGG